MLAEYNNWEAGSNWKNVILTTRFRKVIIYTINLFSGRSGNLNLPMIMNLRGRVKHDLSINSCHSRPAVKPASFLFFKKHDLVQFQSRQYSLDGRRFTWFFFLSTRRPMRIPDGWKRVTGWFAPNFHGSGFFCDRKTKYNYCTSD